jgi:hypothetical protein
VSPTQRSLKHLRAEGYVCWVTEHWNAFAHIRQDLFGIIDIIALKDGETLGVQTTSGDNVSARVKKIAGSEYLPAINAAGWKIRVHGWRLNAAGRYVLREIDCSNGHGHAPGAHGVGSANGPCGSSGL